ncbi:MAG: hypothetical protein IEMM0001_0597 [bacterium]|nr:MAG: hypothetical protein IEMM0001_0597 [bacterium]
MKWFCNPLGLKSLQYDLGMSIGMELRLKPMIEHFLKTALQSLDMTGAHFYLWKTGDAGRFYDPPCLGGYASHFLSLPETIEYRPHQSAKINLTINQIESKSGMVVVHENNLFSHIFLLDGVGVIVLESKNHPFEQKLCAALGPIMKRLRTSCLASLQHEQFLVEINARKEAESTIKHLAYHDTLTDLPNRRLILEKLEDAIESAKKGNYFGAMLFLDLDHFKTINDSLGHLVGDALLKAIAIRLTSSLREEDTVARLGGDEFVVLLPQVATDKDGASDYARLVIEKINHSLATPYNIKGNVLHSSASTGIVIFPEGDSTSLDVLKYADTAMYQAKAAGCGTADFFSSSMRIAANKRLQVEKELRLALDTDQLSLHFQPQYNIDRNIIGAEALVRWYHPDRGFIMPGDFVPIAEKTGLILAMDEWVLFNACEQIVEWKDKGLLPSGFRLAINLSGRQFMMKNFVQNIKQIIDATGVDASFLELELTERLLISNIEETSNKIKELQGLGIQFSIDDFGTGYSALSCLKRLPVDRLKIDQSFVRDITTDPSDAAIVDTIIVIALHLGIDVIAEGVETEDQYNILLNKGCTSYQGYYFGYPMISKSFEKLLFKTKEDPLQIMHPDRPLGTAYYH